MAKLGDVFSLIRNGASIKQTDGAGGIPITRIETISDKEINREKLGYADICDITKYSDYILKDKDILMSHINSEKHLGKAAIYHHNGTEQIIHGMNLLILRADTTYLLPEYAIHFFNSHNFLKQIPNITKKSVNQASFTVTALKELDIPFPSKDVQYHIASILDKINDLIALRKQQLDKLDELVKARFVEMFGDCQKYRRLEDYSVLITKGASPKWQGVDYTDSGTLFVTSENVREGYLDLSKKKYLDNKINEIQPRSVLQKGDILVNIVGASIGRAASYDCEELANINQAVALIRVNTRELNLRFLLTFLNSEQAIEMYSKMKKGGARDNLSLKNIADLSLPVTSIEKQEKFATFALQVDKYKLTIQQGRDKLEVLKKALMQQYFEGETDHEK